MNRGDVYNVKLGSASHVVPNAVITGRIHPFGDHYRFAGVFLISTSPLILDPDVLMSAYENDGLKKIESILLRKGSSLQSILNKYPHHWIDWMCEHYGLKERLKKEKIQRIEMDFFWKEEKPVSTIGMLRQKGLMVVGKMVFGDRQFKVAFIPVEIREGLKSVLRGYEG